MKKLITLTASLLAILGIGLSGCGQQKSTAKSASSSTKVMYDHGPQKKASSLERANSTEKARLDKRQSKLNSQQASLKAANKAAAHKSTTSAPATTKSSGVNLSSLTYSGQQEITVNQNKPGFSRAELSTKNGAWATYHNLDSLNRVTGAAALLNQSLMPSAKRETLTVDPTGWHNKRTSHGWLYNRSHLIGYQFTGQNNNPKNLMTGTRTLNSPCMLHNEMDVATYLKESKSHYVRYAVTPIFKGNELVARGVQMRAQSIGSNAVHFNVYIFNVEPGYTIDYTIGYSRVS
ncbi:DNA/RNA non-specific endonuclease [Levilactobacillus parabrevis]|uniref:DNA-entry nuclease n=1 Tax=Levilactobacillus parabrevis ATCC 53295 TaxID=1267003 RepID=A0A0R1GXS7_9LACO|nr:DNA/RNA non-specific endonuclease [Levilactobacillus parabrevis]KRK39197.1 DNA-entry nuclease [Levilactobacillus parabrevis ATCC 53295]KRO06714.1 DNA-entry nuclease [Levilactobacillus parabrevis]